MKREMSPPPNCRAAMLWFTMRSAQHSVNGSFFLPSCKAPLDAWTRKFLSCSSSVNADAVVRELRKLFAQIHPLPLGEGRVRVSRFDETCDRTPIHSQVRRGGECAW